MGFYGDRSELSTEPHRVRQRLRRGTETPERARELLGGKPIEEWDLDELARGRPRNKAGNFFSPVPAWVTPEMREDAWQRYKEHVRGELQAGSINAVSRVRHLIDEAESDRVRLDASKFVLEFLLGKATQEVKGSVQLNVQALLAGMLVNPGGEPAEPEVDYELDDDDIEDLD